MHCQLDDTAHRKTRRIVGLHDVKISAIVPNEPAGKVQAGGDQGCHCAFGGESEDVAKRIRLVEIGNVDIVICVEREAGPAIIQEFGKRCLLTRGGNFRDDTVCIGIGIAAVIGGIHRAVGRDCYTANSK